MANISSTLVLLVSVSLVLGPSLNLAFEITLIHTNDVHSRFQQVNAKGNECTPKDEAKKACYGGFARLYHKAEEIRKNYPNVIYLSGGDYYQGTVWYTLFKAEIVSYFVNKLNHTAMALGNHEFDDGVPGLLPFLENATFPIISANIDTSNEPRIQGKFKKSIVVEYEGRKIGIIGYTTEETMDISNPGKTLFFKNVTESVGAEAKRLYEEEGIRIIIAVGHAGYEVDLLVAEQPYIDAVVGGHTNTFLYKGTAPNEEIPEDEYPRIVKRPDGRLVPVVQAFAYGKYLGFLNLTFNDEGDLVNFTGNPILLDYSVPQDPQILREVNVWKEKVNARTKVEVGQTRVLLDGTRDGCRKGECNLGNVIADAQVFYNFKFDHGNHPNLWAEVTLGIVHSGSIRLSVSEKNKNGSITLEDILSIQPFGHNVDMMKIKGKHLRETFEFSVSGLDRDYFDPSGKFLQVSGFRIVYDLSKPNGSRVKKIHVLCQKCRIPKYIPLDDEEIYTVSTPGYLIEGGGGFDVIKNNVIEHTTVGVIDSDVLIEYFSTRKPITQGIEGRIIFESGDNPCKRNEEPLPQLGGLTFLPEPTIEVINETDPRYEPPKTSGLTFLPEPTIEVINETDFRYEPPKTSGLTFLPEPTIEVINETDPRYEPPKTSGLTFLPEPTIEVINETDFRYEPPKTSGLSFLPEPTIEVLNETDYMNLKNDFPKTSGLTYLPEPTIEVLNETDYMNLKNDSMIGVTKLN